LVQQLVLLVKLVKVQEARGIAWDQLEAEHKQMFGHWINSEVGAQTF